MVVRVVPASVLIVQHAEKDSRPGDPGLTATGRHQAASVAAALIQLEPALIVSSPLLRARETAVPLAVRCGLELRTDPRLRERLNLEVGQDRRDFVAVWQTSTRDRDWSPPGGRSSRATAADMRQAIDAHAVLGRAVVLVGHGGATVDLLREMLGDEELDARAPGLILDGLPAAGITTLVRAEGGWTVTSIGRTSHLQPVDWTP